MNVFDNTVSGNLRNECSSPIVSRYRLGNTFSKYFLNTRIRKILFYRIKLLTTRFFFCAGIALIYYDFTNVTHNMEIAIVTVKI